VEPVIENFITKDVNQLYRNIAHEEDHINPTADGMLSWRSISYFPSNSHSGI
jgi:hypothetical protein